MPEHLASSNDAGRVVLPEIAEALSVETVRVDRGGYRLTKHVDSRTEQVDVTLNSEHVEIERRPIGRRLADDECPGPHHEGETLVIPVIEEVVFTETRRMLVEEVRVTRVTTTRADAHAVTLRQERIEIERLGADIPVLRSSYPPSDRQIRPEGLPEQT